MMAMWPLSRSLFYNIFRKTDIKSATFTATVSSLADQHNSKIRRYKLIADLFNISQEDAHKLMKYNKAIAEADFSRLEKMKQVLLKMEINLSDLVKYPQITTHIPGAVEQHFYRMKELGFSNIDLNLLLKYKDIVHQTVSSLDSPQNALDFLISYTDGPPNLKKILFTSYGNIENQTLNWLHRAVVLEYLVWRMNLSHEEILAIVDKYPTIANKSLTTLKETFASLTEDVGLPLTKIQTNGFLLIVSKENIESILKELSFLGGLPVREYLQRFPRILSLNVENVKLIEQILKNFDITNEQIWKCGNIYSFNATTLGKRLRAILKVPEFAEMKSSHRFLHLVYYFHKATERLAVAKQLGFTNITVDLLCTSDSRFAERIGLVGNRQKWTKIIEYLSKKLKIPVKTIKNRMGIDEIYENFDVLTIADTEKTLNYLLSTFLPEEINENLLAFLFTEEMIKNELTLVRQQSRTKVNMLADVVNRLILKNRKEVNQEEDQSDVNMKYGRPIDIAENLTIDKYLVPQRKARKSRSLK